MKLIKGKSTYRILKHDKVIRAIIRDRKKYFDFELYQRNMDFGIATLTTGKPTSFSVKGNKIEFYPIPDKNYMVKITLARIYEV